MRQRAFIILICALSLSGCGEQTSGRYGAGGQFGSNAPNSLGPNMQRSDGTGRSVAMLLPLSGPRADIGHVLEQAARLALLDSPGPALDVLDTGGTAAGAVTAAQTAVGNHVGLILGPLTSTETAAVAPIARNAGIPVLAFTNNASQSAPGVWTLGITAGQQVSRLVTAAQAQGKSQFGALLPDTEFGRAMANALTKATEAAGMPPPIIRMHAPGMGSITASARDLSDYANRRGPIDAKVKAARALGTAEGRHEAQELVKTPIPPPAFNVLLLADTGEQLQEIAAILPYYDVDRSAAQIVGPALWSDPASGSSAVHGAWYAAPDNSTRSNLERDYDAKYGSPPPPLADLAFDSAAIARVVLGSNGVDMTALTHPSGFIGTDGWLILQPDGQVRRGLAVFKIDRAGPTMIDPPPQPSSIPAL